MSRYYCNNGRASGHLVFGVFLVALGLLYLLNNLGIIFVPSLWRLIWPALIIWVGVKMILREPGRGRSWDATGDFGPRTDSDAVLSLTAILGGAEHKGGGREFSHGTLTAFMGGVNVDFRDAKMIQDQAVLDVFAVMGGIEIIVPRDWKVESRVTPLLGGYEDKTDPPKDTTKRLIIQGTVIMGGVEVKS